MSTKDRILVGATHGGLFIAMVVSSAWSYVKYNIRKPEYR
jgi:hypothetical protein